MSYTPILATLGYILSADARQVLLVHRNKRPDDPHFGKYNGLGGKLQPGEDIIACMRREIKEEADLECVNMVLRGTISWPGFGKQGEDWFGFIFRIDAWNGTPRTDNVEGILSWIPVDQLLNLPLWEGDRHFLPLVFDRDSRQFHGVMPYRDGKPLSWTFTRLLPDGSVESTNTNQPGAALIRQARRFLARGEFANAINCLDVHRPAEWTVVDGLGARILRLLGQAYARRGEWSSARECLEQLRSAQREQRLLDSLPYAAALTDLLHCYENLGMAEAAEQIGQEVCGIR